ncbi:peptidylprolyl isomerase [Faecalimonas umbilicata]|nr:peptidylprolyl isomerase [Faecalimonas umbilicata]
MEEKRNPIAIIVTRFGEIKIELYPKEAPNTVNCFISLAKKGLFDHRKIRRIAPGFVLQPSYSDFEDER